MVAILKIVLDLVSKSLTVRNTRHIKDLRVLGNSSLLKALILWLVEFSLQTDFQQILTQMQMIQL